MAADPDRRMRALLDDGADGVLTSLRPTMCQRRRCWRSSTP
jgi:hypothetical protein